MHASLQRGQDPSDAVVMRIRHTDYKTSLISNQQILQNQHYTFALHECQQTQLNGVKHDFSKQQPNVHSHMLLQPDM